MKFKLVLYLFFHSIILIHAQLSHEKIAFVRHHFYTGNYDEAKRYAFAVLKLTKNKPGDISSVHASLFIARCFYVRYRFKEAEKVVSVLKNRLDTMQNVGFQNESYLQLAEYLIETNEIQQADSLFQRIKISNPKNLFWPQADFILIQSKLLIKQGYASKAIANLENLEAIRKQYTVANLLKNESFFADKLKNEKFFNEKNTDAKLALAEACLRFGDIEKAKDKIQAVKAIADRLLGKGSRQFLHSCLLEAELFEQLHQPNQTLKSLLDASQVNELNENDPLRIQNLVMCIKYYYTIGNLIDGQDYFRRLQILANRTMGSKEPVHLAYEYTEAYRLFNDNNPADALKKLNKLKARFNFLPALHPDKEVINAFISDIYMQTGEIGSYRSIQDTIIKNKSISVGNIVPAYHQSVINKTDYMSLYANLDPEISQSWNESFYKVCRANWYKDSPLLLKAEAALVNYYLRTDQYDSALVVQRKVMASCGAIFGENSLYFLISNLQLADVLLFNGKYDKAVAIAGQIENQLTEMPSKSSPRLIEVYRRLSQLSSMFGNLNNSRIYLREAVSLSERVAINYTDKFLLQNHQAMVAIESGNYYRSESIIKNLIRSGIKTLGNDQYLLFKPRLLAAEQSINSGNYAETEKLITEASSFTAPNTVAESDVLMMQAEFYVAISDYKKALEAIKKADAILVKKMGPEHYSRAFTLSREAFCISRFSDNTTVESLYLKVSELLKNSLGISHPLYAENLQKLADFYIQTGSVEKAGKLLNESLKFWLAQIGENNENVASIKFLLGKIAYRKNDYAQAKIHFEKAAIIYKNIFNEQNPAYISTQSQLARVYFMQNEIQRSFATMEEIVPRYLDYAKKYFPVLSFRQRSRYWNVLKDDFEFYYFLALDKIGDKQPSLRGKVYDMVIATKAMLLSSDIKTRQRILNSGDTLLVETFNKWLAGKDMLTSVISLSTEEQAKEGISVRQIENDLEALEKRLIEMSEVFASTEKKRNIHWETIREVLSKNETAIEMVRYRTFNKTITDSIRYAALIIQSNTRSVPDIIKLENGHDLEKRFLKYYRNAIVNKFEDEETYSQFWAPVKTKIPDYNTVYFSSEGAYSQLNVETLKNGSDYVIDQNTIVLVTNTKDIVPEKKVKTAKNLSVTAPTLVVCGNPDFYQENTGNTQSINELPGAEREAQIIEGIVKPSGKYITKLLNGQITEDTLKKIKNPSIFHIATHGYFKETNSKNDDDIASNPLLNSGLLLSGSGDILDNHENTYINQKDGILTAYEALDLNFDNTDLVVLSACETGRGDVQIGEGVFGLQRSFLVAGAKSLIISLFKVNDEVTQTLMKLFYEKWLATGNIRQSFIEAKKEIKKQYPEPIYWGSFVMIEGKPSQTGLMK